MTLPKEPHIADITQVIQLAIAPVFLLTAIGTLIVVLTNRLSRAIDRSRALEDRLPSLQANQAGGVRAELHLLARRIRLVYLAISLAVLSALFICLLIAGAFVGAFVATDLSRLVAVLFVLAILALTGSLVVFLREIFLAVTSARLAIPEEDR
ncbi:MAG: DUF2721 domain-containing protein [Burkholderiales bacterium]